MASLEAPTNGMVRSTSDSQLEKTLSPILVRLFGRTINVRLRQFENARSPIVSTPSGIAIDSSLTQPENASLPIAVMQAGRVIDVRSLHS